VEASLLVSLHALGAASQAELHLRQQGREMPSAEQLAATAAPLMQQSMAAAAPSGGKRAAAAPLEPDSKRQRAGESASGAGGGGGSHGSGMHLEKNAGASMPLTRLPAAQIAQLQQMLCMLAPEMVAELVISSMSHLPPRPAPLGAAPPGAAPPGAARAPPRFAGACVASSTKAPLGGGAPRRAAAGCRWPGLIS